MRTGQSPKESVLVDCALSRVMHWMTSRGHSLASSALHIQ